MVGKIQYHRAGGLGIAEVALGMDTLGAHRKHTAHSMEKSESLIYGRILKKMGWQVVP